MRTCMIVQITLDIIMVVLAILYICTGYRVQPWVFLVWVLLALEGHVSKYMYWKQNEQDNL